MKRRFIEGLGKASPFIFSVLGFVIGKFYFGIVGGILGIFAGFLILFLITRLYVMVSPQFVHPMLSRTIAEIFFDDHSDFVDTHGINANDVIMRADTIFDGAEATRIEKSDKNEVKLNQVEDFVIHTLSNEVDPIEIEFIGRILESIKKSRLNRLSGDT